MPRAYPLAQQVDGMSALRIKGGASDTALQMLLNGWITSKRTVEARPGFPKHLDLPAGTVGVLGFGDKFHTFSATPVAGTVDPNVVVNVLIPPAQATPTLTKIHKAFVFLGRIYVSAQFADGTTRHYYVESFPSWAASTSVPYGSGVQPRTPNGFYYENLTLAGDLAWQASTLVSMSERRQPTSANGYGYRITATTGAGAPQTSITEPTWPTAVGATVVERRYITETTVVNPGSPTPTPGGGTGRPGEYAPYPPDPRRETRNEQ